MRTSLVFPSFASLDSFPSLDSSFTTGLPAKLTLSKKFSGIILRQLGQDATPYKASPLEAARNGYFTGLKDLKMEVAACNQKEIAIFDTHQESLRKLNEKWLDVFGSDQNVHKKDTLHACLSLCQKAVSWLPTF